MGELGMSLASQAIGTGLGLMANKINQGNINQQMEWQKKNAKEITDYNVGKQIELFNATGAAAQKNQIERAGLSVGLMYGNASGAGGTTAIAQGNGGSGSSNANIAQNEVGNNIELGQRLKNLKANEKNTEKDTEKKDTEIIKTKGVDTKKIETEIAKNETENKFLKGSLEDRITTAYAIGAKAIEEANIAKTENTITSRSANDKIKQASLQTGSMILEQAFTSSKTKLTEAQEDKAIEELESIIYDRIVKARQLNQKDNEIDIAKKRNEISEMLGRLNIDLAERKIISENLMKIITIK